MEVIDRTAQRPENAHAIKVNVESNTGSFGLSNKGFRGMGIKKGEVYSFTVTASKPAGSLIKLIAELPVNAR